MLAPGTRLGRYRILSPLGAGGMGEVYRGRDERLGREVAIKVLPRELANDADRLARFEQEARVVSGLNHPNILVLHDVGTADGVPYLVTELLAGASLRSRLAGAGLPAENALRLALQAARGLAAAHERGIAHRDLKPENLFVTDDGAVKILDFGLAKALEPGGTAASVGEEATAAGASLTAAGAVLGSAGYMAPEQARGRPSDQRADIFAFGCVLYEMLTGRAAFPGASAAERTSALLRDEPVLPRELPAALASLLRHCLAKDPRQRWQSARDLALELEALRETVRELQPGTASRDGDRLASLVVLPFENRTGDPTSEYLAEGIAESLINDLSHARDLKVLGRATSFRFRDAPAPDAVARQLGVAAALSGRVLQVAGRLVVRAELTRAEDGAHLAGVQCDHPPGDVLAVQERISHDIAAAVLPHLPGGERRRSARRSTGSDSAYDLYLKGRYFLYKRTVAAFRQAMGYFEAAVAADPDYALAWSGLADCLILLERYGATPPGEVMDRARQAAERALAADETVAEGHCSRGVVAYYFEWDWARGERELRRAIELKPGYATAHHWLGWCLGELGRSAESIALLERALEIDPLSLIIQTNLGTMLYFARRHGAAERRLREALALEPGFAVAHQWLGRVLGAQDRWPEAVGGQRRALELVGEEPECVASLAHACARAGQAAEAAARSARLAELARERWVSPYWLALVELGLGRSSEALDQLARAVDERMDWVIALGVEPMFDALRGEPRFADLLRRIGLPGA